MMKKYLISIEKTDSPRLNRFFDQSTFLNFKDDFKIFGVIGKELTVSEYFTQGVAGKTKAMTPGELGCCLSHIAALKDFLSSEDEYAIIFEDDAIQRFDIDLDQLEKDIQDLNLDPSFFLSLGGIQMKVCRKLRGEYQIKKLYSQSLLKVDSQYYENLAYAYAYVVDRSMAKELLIFHKTPQVYDQWIKFSLKKNIQFYVSYLFDHPDIQNIKEGSYLESERNDMKTNDRHYIGFNISYLLKKIKGFFLSTYKIK